MPDREFTPEEIAKGEEITAYYQREDLPPPDDDETARPSPLKAMQDDFSKPVSKDGQCQMTEMGDNK